MFKAFTSIPILLDAEADYRIPLRRIKKGNPRTRLQRLAGQQSLQSHRPIDRRWRIQSVVPAGPGMPMLINHRRVLFALHLHRFRRGHPAKWFPLRPMLMMSKRDPVIIVDGLTKNWRYPGWRISWTLGPKAVIEAIASAGSFLDGGANHPFQNAAAQIARSSTRHAGDRRHPKAFRQKARLCAGPSQAHGHHRRCRAGGGVLRLGESF